MNNAAQPDMPDPNQRRDLAAKAAKSAKKAWEADRALARRRPITSALFRFISLAGLAGLAAKPSSIRRNACARDSRTREQAIMVLGDRGG
jgi:hypothetical protein